MEKVVFHLEIKFNILLFSTIISELKRIQQKRVARKQEQFYRYQNREDG